MTGLHGAEPRGLGRVEVTAGGRTTKTTPRVGDKTCTSIPESSTFRPPTSTRAMLQPEHDQQSSIPERTKTTAFCPCRNPAAQANRGNGRAFTRAVFGFCPSKTHSVPACSRWTVTGSRYDEAMSRAATRTHQSSCLTPNEEPIKPLARPLESRRGNQQSTQWQQQEEILYHQQVAGLRHQLQIKSLVYQQGSNTERTQARTRRHKHPFPYRVLRESF